MPEMRFHIRDRHPLWEPGDPIDIAAIFTQYEAEGQQPELVVPLPDGTIVVQLAETAPVSTATLGPIARAAWLADQPAFVRRVQLVLFKVAVEVQRELATVAAHTARSQLAYQVLRDPGRFARLFAAALAANYDAMRDAAFTDPAAPDQTRVTDAAILTAVRDLWTSFAVNGG